MHDFYKKTKTKPNKQKNPSKTPSRVSRGITTRDFVFSSQRRKLTFPQSNDKKDNWKEEMKQRPISAQFWGVVFLQLCSKPIIQYSDSEVSALVEAFWFWPYLLFWLQRSGYLVNQLIIAVVIVLVAWVRIWFLSSTFLSVL